MTSKTTKRETVERPTVGTALGHIVYLTCSSFPKHSREVLDLHTVIFELLTF